MLHNFRYILTTCLCLLLILGCQKAYFNDTTLGASATSPNKLSVLFDITQDNKGLVTITPNGEGVVSYDVYYGDSTTLPIVVLAGKSVQHTYTEGTYTVKIVAHNISGKTATFTQSLTVSFKAPENLKVTISSNILTVDITATAQNETYFKVFFGDSNNVTPIPYKTFLEGQTISHTYAAAGTYIIKVVALSGGAATTTHQDTIKIAKQINLPVTFNDPAVDYTMSDFGGDVSALVTDPTNTNQKVMKVTKTSGAEVWAGTTIGTNLGFATAVPLSSNTMKMSVNVYAPAAGMIVKLKLEDRADPTRSVETNAITTVANQWETLSFDFNNPSPGTSAWNPAYTYNKASIFFDFGKPGIGAVFYFYNLKMMPAALSQINLPVTFDSPTVNYTVTDFGNNQTTDATDPSNASNPVKKTIKPAGAETWAGTTIGTPLGFASPIPLTSVASKMSVRIYAPAAGITIRLKIEDHTDPTHSVETNTVTTVANQWETLIFDFSNPAVGTASWNASYTYDKASIFFDFGNTGNGAAYYWDDVRFLQQINLPVNFTDPNVDYTVTDFGNNSSSTAVDPTNSSKSVKKSIKLAGAEVWAGTTIGTPAGFASVIPISATRTKMTVRVYAPAVGIKIKLKIEDHNAPAYSVETDVLTTVANQWETLTFDFANPSSGTPAWNVGYIYDKASIFFDFGNSGDGRAYYWTDVIFL